MIKKIISYIKMFFAERKHRKDMKKRLEEIEKNDPFIYK
tara:strand:+ start:365 stop:481 length:117 start_codon:yes stop_codon:yes gene_type:complete